MNARVTHPRIRRSVLTAAAIVGGLASAAGVAHAATREPQRTGTAAAPLVQPGTVHLAGRETRRQAAPIIHVARELYTFWDTGDTAYLDRAVSPSFRDHTLPAGRTQGRNGIAAASRTFRAAVPDLRCRLVNLYVTGSTFTAQLVFSGHFTGTLDDHEGVGQAIRFNAIDIQRVGAAGRIVEDWHIEDNLTLLEQAGVVTAP